MNTDEKMRVSEESKQNVKYRDTDVDVSVNLVMVRNILKNGMCEQHQEMSTRFQVTSQVWKDRGGGRGHGYVSKKVAKRVCRAKKALPIVSKNSTNDGSMSQVASSGQKVRVTFDGRLASETGQ